VVVAEAAACIDQQQVATHSGALLLGVCSTHGIVSAGHDRAVGPVARVRPHAFIESVARSPPALVRSIEPPAAASWRARSWGPPPTSFRPGASAREFHRPDLRRSQRVQERGKVPPGPRPPGRCGGAPSSSGRPQRRPAATAVHILWMAPYPEGRAPSCSLEISRPGRFRHAPGGLWRIGPDCSDGPSTSQRNPFPGPPRRAGSFGSTTGNRRGLRANGAEQRTAPGPSLKAREIPEIHSAGGNGCSTSRAWLGDQAAAARKITGRHATEPASRKAAPGLAELCAVDHHGGKPEQPRTCGTPD